MFTTAALLIVCLRIPQPVPVGDLGNRLDRFPVDAARATAWREAQPPTARLEPRPPERLGSPNVRRDRPPEQLWQIGAPDGSADDFALVPDGFAHFNEEFPGDPLFIVGSSDAKTAWPFVHPGPVDAWVGNRIHTFTIVFGLKTPPREGVCRLVIDLVDAHRSLPPKFEVRINGAASEHQTASGTSDTLEHRTSAIRKQQFVATIPASALKAGNNTLTITTLSGSWLVYDAASFEAPAGATLGSVEPETRILGGQGSPALLRQRDGKPWQEIRLTVQHIGAPTEAKPVISSDVPIDAPKPGLVTLRPGIQYVSVPAPLVEKPTQINVALEVVGKAVARQEIDLKPVRRWTLYLLPHSHNDIGYTDVQTEVERKQWEYLELAIEAARKTADYPPDARFKWNVEVMWAVDGYLRQASPEKQKAFVEAVKAGWIELDALYANELTGLCRPEELVRLVDCAGQVSRLCGTPLESAMISDIPGYTWGIVPILAQAGVKYFSVGPNPGDRIGRTLAAWGDKPFYWISPSGQERVLCWMAGRGYAFFHRGTLDKTGEKPILDYLGQLANSGYPYDLVQMRYSVGGDNGPPDPAMCDFVKDWNAKFVSPRLVIATVSRMCRDFEKQYGDRLPQVRGDFTPYWEDGAASSARETAINRASAERLTQAETLFAMLIPAPYPVAMFDSAWRNVLLYDEHTWGAWNSISEPDAKFVKDQWEIKQAFALDGKKQSRELLAIVTLAFGASADKRAVAVDVFNTSSWPRTDLVTLPKGFKSAGRFVKDSDASAVPFQRLSTGERVFLADDVPPFGAKRFMFNAKSGGVLINGKAKVDKTTLSTPTLTVKIDENTGAIISLKHIALDTDLVSPKAAVSLNDYRYMRGSDTAGAKTNGPVKITVKEPGPLVASLLIESDAPGCSRLTREVMLVDGLETVFITDTVDKNAVREKEGVHFGFAFNVPDGVMRMDIPWAIVRPEADQIAGACKNWFTVQRWVDISNAYYGVTWATVDAPLVEVGAMTADRIGSLSDPSLWLDHLEPSQTLYAWVMNNHWHTNYKADQEGPTTFHFAIRPHGPYDAVAAQHFGIERSQPLLAVPVDPDTPTPGSYLRVEPAAVLVTALKPSGDGKGIVVRLFNTTDEPVKAKLAWGDAAPKSVWLSTLSEERVEKAPDEISLPAWGIVTLRAEK